MTDATTDAIADATPAQLSFTFEAESHDEFVERHAVDLTRTGVFLRDAEPLPVGTDVEFVLRLKDGSELLSGRGSVAWTREPEGEVAGGLGLRFDRLPLASRKALDRILAPKEALDTRRERASGSYPRIDSRATRSEPSESVLVLKPSAKASGLGDFVSPSTRERPPTGPAWMTADEDEDSAPAGWLSWVMLLVVLGGCGYVVWAYVLREDPASSQAGRPAPKAAVFADGAAGGASVQPVAIRLESRPPGARILFGGKDTGKKTPAVLEGLDPRLEQEVTFRLKGNAVARRRIKPARGMTIRATLVPLRRLLRVESLPPGAAVKLDGRVVGKTPCDVPARRLGRKRHVLRYDHDGYEGHELPFSPAALTWERRGDADEVALLKVKLKKTAP